MSDSSELSLAEGEGAAAQRSARGFFRRAVERKRAAVLQRIGWLRPSAQERRLWLVEGLIILTAVLVIGTLMFVALR